MRSLLKKFIPSEWRRRAWFGLARRMECDREFLSARYIRGSGIEIGGRGFPLRVVPGARVRQVDHLSEEQLRRECLTEEERHRVRVDVVDDAQWLEKFEPESLDFIIANHVLEHLEDPLTALERYFELLRGGGVLFLAIPEKRRTFDAARPVTTLEHLIADQQDGGAASRHAHHEEAVRLTPGIRSGQVEEKIAETFTANPGSIHYHCWTQWEMLEIFLHLRRRGLDFELEHFMPLHKECLLLLRKGVAGAVNGHD